ncbi:hypothetical protein [Jonesia quinghaiensis]|uniref:hypothetical protein n=1 Tax=Jonesia quinghaiensis TaxID=262806 RepID=UPI0004279E82|nr:hypothetical protein [Jonesia quinghaiensis]
MNDSIQRTPQFTEEQAAERLAFADAALGAAGHQVTDPYLNEITVQFARGEITIEEASELGDRHILGR